jgi:hypothetical protein
MIGYHLRIEYSPKFAWMQQNVGHCVPELSCASALPAWDGPAGGFEAGASGLQGLGARHFSVLDCLCIAGGPRGVRPPHLLLSTMHRGRPESSLDLIIPFCNKRERNHFRASNVWGWVFCARSLH